MAVAVVLVVRMSWLFVRGWLLVRPPIADRRRQRQ
jgi:hypothetical protein